MHDAIIFNFYIYFHSFTHSPTHTLIHSCIHSIMLINPSIHSFIHLFLHSFINLVTTTVLQCIPFRLFVYLCTYCFCVGSVRVHFSIHKIACSLSLPVFIHAPLSMYWLRFSQYYPCVISCTSTKAEFLLHSNALFRPPIFQEHACLLDTYISVLQTSLLLMDCYNGKYYMLNRQVIVAYPKHLHVHAHLHSHKHAHIHAHAHRLIEMHDNEGS